jgi:pyruvate formate lyase activating enzyme
MVTAGYIDKNARKDVYKYIDAANVDLKAFSEVFYRKLTLSNLNDVLDTLIWLKNETDVWFEITTLLIPGENDSDQEIKQMCAWILENLGDNVPLHFTAFHPDFKMTDKSPTPLSTVYKARKIALYEGINYCYTGNVYDPEGQTTFCPVCKTPLIERNWHSVHYNKIKQGKCPNCLASIAGVF